MQDGPRHAQRDHEATFGFLVGNVVSRLDKGSLSFRKRSRPVAHDPLLSDKSRRFGLFCYGGYTTARAVARKEDCQTFWAPPYAFPGHLAWRRRREGPSMRSPPTSNFLFRSVLSTADQPSTKVEVLER